MKDLPGNVTSGHQSLLGILRQTTQEHHKKLDALPFLAQLFAPIQPAQWYAEFLAAQIELHLRAEAALVSVNSHELPGVWHPLCVNGFAACLGQELSYIAHEHLTPPPGQGMSVFQHARIKEQLREDKVPPFRGPDQLLGSLYVLEGARMGSIQISKILQQKGFSHPKHVEFWNGSQKSRGLLHFSGPRYLGNWQHFELICTYYDKLGQVNNPQFLKNMKNAALWVFEQAYQIFSNIPCYNYKSNVKDLQSKT